MPSPYLARLTPAERDALVKQLHESQGGNCFICDEPIDLEVHAGALDIDHVRPLATRGKDDPSNLALCHAHCNRSKQASDLRVARILARFGRLAPLADVEPNRPNLRDVLDNAKVRTHAFKAARTGNLLRFSLLETGGPAVVEVPIHRDELSRSEYAFVVLPIEYLSHDDRINPRAIAVTSLRKLVEEFHAGFPQLHPSLGWISLTSSDDARPVRVFDGQHKAAAQIMLGVRELPVRLFIDPDLDRLLAANTHAGTTLRQVAFDQAVQRRLGSQLYRDRVARYLADMGRDSDDQSFSEQDLVNHFRGQWAEVKRYVLDDARDSITHDPENRLRGYIDFGGRGAVLPLSYTAIERTFYSRFLYQGMLTTPVSYRVDLGENPRDIEIEQIRRLMNLVVDRVLVDRYDLKLGAYQIENKIAKGEDVPLDHLRAFRLTREEILGTWLRSVRDYMQMYVVMNGLAVDSDRLMQSRLPDPLWEMLERLIDGIRDMPVWVNTHLATTVFGGKRNQAYWQSIFLTGRTPDGQQVLAAPVNVIDIVSK